MLNDVIDNNVTENDVIDSWMNMQTLLASRPNVVASTRVSFNVCKSIISPLLKKSTLDKDLLSNYRPISNLSVVSKIIERIVKSRLTDHLSSNNLLNPHQSAYCKHHPTETALSYIHDHLINAIGSHKKFLSLSS